MPQLQDEEYLGDSVYVAHDGYHIVVTTSNGYADDQRNKIALEPSVLRRLYKYVEKFKEKNAEVAP